MKINKLIALMLAAIMLLPTCAMADDKKDDKSSVKVSSSGALVKDGNELSGFYNKVYYSNGRRDRTLNAVMKIDGMEYCLRQGKSFTGIWGSRYYKNGLWCSYLNGRHEVDGKDYTFVNGEISNKKDEKSGPAFTDRFNLYTGPLTGFYYENGQIDFKLTGYRTFLNDTYYVRAGRLYDGYFEGCFYRDGLADRNVCGIRNIDGEKLCFMAGYLYTGVYENIYFENGRRSDVSGYKTIDNVRYYLNKGALANGVFDGAYFKNGLVDTSMNGKIEVDGSVYTFINGITSDGLHDGKWYTNGKFDKSANGVKIYGGTPYFVKDGRLSTGVALYEKALRYFKNGVINNFTGWTDIENERYYIDKSYAASGVKEIEETMYLFDENGKLCKGKEAIYQNVVYLSDEEGKAYLAPLRFTPQRGSNIPYPHSAHPNGTISSSGCGVCSSLMIIENETNFDISLEDWTKKMLAAGCRISSGSDMNTTAKLLEKEFGITCEVTDSNEKLKEHLKKGYMAVANVGKIPLFSFTGGHYVAVVGLKDENTPIIFDPNVREGKYGTGVRKNISYNSENNEVYASFDTLRSDAQYGCYYLFTPTKNIALRKSSTNYDAKSFNKNGELDYAKVQELEKAIEEKAQGDKLGEETKTEE